MTNQTDSLNVKQINDAVEKAEFKKLQRQTDENLSRILNPCNAYHKQQDEILKDINERLGK